MSLASLSHAAARSASPKGSLYNTSNSAARWLLVLVLCKKTSSHSKLCVAPVRLPLPARSASALSIVTGGLLCLHSQARARCLCQPAAVPCKTAVVRQRKGLQAT